MRIGTGTAAALVVTGVLVSSCASNPTSVNGKAPVVWGKWELVGKVSATRGFSGEFDADFSVKNLADEPRTGSFTLTFLKGSNVLGTTECTTALDISTPDLGHGEAGPVTCDSGTPFKEGWTDVTVVESPGGRD